MAKIRGTQKGDRLVADDEDDEIFGLAGDDVIRGRGGNDRLAGGPGDDLIFGQGGADRIFGHAGNDELRGGAGNDRIAGGHGVDRILGHGGADQLLGQGGNDRIYGGSGADRIAGGLGNDRIVGQAGADVLTGGPGADRFVYGSLTHAGDVITDFTRGDGDLLALTGSLNGAEEVRVADGDDTVVAVRPSGEQTFTELVVLRGFAEPSSGPIDVWYGEVQTFGDPGVPQRWVNVLGNVETDGLASLTWSLNGGQPQPLAFPTTSGNFNRLANEGDFNVELDFDRLDPSAAHDLVTIRAAYGGGDVFTREVLIDYQGGRTWPTDYGIEWSQVNDLQDVVQVVDGLWSFDDSGVRPVETGYDRVLAIGDRTWDSYEVRLSVTMNELNNPDVGGEALWFGMQWGGHTDDPIPGQVPHAGYIPGATFMVQSTGIVLRPSEFLDDRVPENSRVGSGAAFQEGETYEFLIRNERVAADDDLSDGLDRTYGIKAWRAGDDEPDNFLIQETMIDQEPFGSFYMNAHFVDVTFGDVTVRGIGPPPLLASDVLQGDDSLKPLLAAASEPSDGASMQNAAGGGSTPAAGPTMTLSDLLASDETAVAA